MNSLRYIFINIVETLLRVLPIPNKTGMIEIGKPGRNAPVFLTCNYHLTVERVKRALRGTDCYLLVGNSKGHNVWCGATGGHFTNHHIISLLKTSNIESLVDHRNAVLPQLAATGVEARTIKKKTGWNVIWGPVYAKDIPAFIENNFKKTSKMREVRFDFLHRIEMAAMWAFPFSIVASLIISPFWTEVLLPLNILIWSLPVLIFASFPLYENWITSRKKTTPFSKYTIIFDFGRIPLFLGTITVSCLIIGGIFFYPLSWGHILRFGFIAFVIILLISTDLLGSTPIYKSGLHEDRFLKVRLDEERCKGAGFCEKVCPRNCYAVDRIRHIAIILNPDQCVQCGACIVQCHFDALCFQGLKGEIIHPETVRKFKLNLFGKRLKKNRE